MHTLLRRLADIESENLPVLSIYLDMQPQETGARPALRSGLVVLKDRLREIEKTFPPRGDDLDSFKADAARVERYLKEELAPATQGLAVFACSGRELFETVEVGVPFENQVSVGPMPDLYQLVRLLDEHETALVAVVDTNTARIFATRVGIMEEIGGPDDDPAQYGKRSMAVGPKRCISAISMGHGLTSRARPRPRSSGSWTARAPRGSCLLVTRSRCRWFGTPFHRE